MLFKSLGRTEPERIFVVFQANETGIAANDCVQFDITTDIDGIKARQPDTGALHAFLGVADAAVANGEYGLAQVYGYRSTSKVFVTDTSVNSGVPLTPIAGEDYFSTAASTVTRVSITTNASLSAATYTVIPAWFAVLAESTTTSDGTVSLKIFLRAL